MPKKHVTTYDELVFYAKDILEQLDQFPLTSAGINRKYLVEAISNSKPRKESKK